MARPEFPLLDFDIIKENLNCRKIGSKILVFNSTKSTNDLARLYAADSDNDGLVIFAEEQTEGKGRFSNQWFSAKFESILCSILLLTNELESEILSIAVAVAVAETIGKTVKSKAQIKWPNDIILNDKKVAGILIEKAKIKKTDKDFCIIGIGINCHQKIDSFPLELRSIATSIDIENNSISDRNLIAKRLLTNADHRLQTAQTKPDNLIRQWRKLSTQLGHRLTLLFNGKKFSGSCIGIDPQKGLILQLERGGIRFFDAAHSSIVK
jgi:BirA family transcriptional regulator, biotin operon repressor / biotin---[acetyl-CoA-carboxylase] ligase